MIPVQTIVTVTVADGSRTADGVAGLTTYVQPEHASRTHGLYEHHLEQWLGVEASTFGADRPARESPYDPVRDCVYVVVQLAIADALGRVSNIPASAFFGGACRARVPAYASLPSFGSAEAAVECAVDACQEGFSGIKFHASGLVDIDVQTIADARDQLGPDVNLLWDGSCSYDLPSALTVAEALTRHRFLWFEAPFADDRGALLRRLSAQAGLPLLPDGMALRSADDWTRDVIDGIWGGFRFDVTYAGTLSEALRLVKLSEAFGIYCEIQTFGFALSQYANLQLVVATPACRFFEAPFPAADFADELLLPPKMVDGDVIVPSFPGLGHDLSIEKVARNAQLVARASLSLN